MSVVFYASTAMLLLRRVCNALPHRTAAGVSVGGAGDDDLLQAAFKPGSAVQNPEKLYREPGLMLWFTAMVVVMVVLLFVRLPWLEKLFVPTLPMVQPLNGPATSSAVVPLATVRLS